VFTRRFGKTEVLRNSQVFFFVFATKGHDIINCIDQLRYIVDFRSAGGLPYEHWSVANIDTRCAPKNRVASLLAGSTSSRPFFCFLCNLRSLHDAQGTDARPCEVSHRYVKSPLQPLRFDVEEGATLNYYNRPKVNDIGVRPRVNDIAQLVYY